MKKFNTKIALFILIGLVFSDCNSLKKVPNGKLLLVKNEIKVDGKLSKDEFVKNLVLQKPNSSVLGIRLPLNLFNLVKSNYDSIYKAKFTNNPDKFKRQSWLLSAKQVERKGHSFLYEGLDNLFKKMGEPPAIVDKNKIDKSIIRLQSYFFNHGYFNTAVTYKIDTIAPKKAKVTYIVSNGKESKIDSLSTKIYTPELDTLYKKAQNFAVLKVGKPYNSQDFDSERERITTHFRNNGVYYFQQSNINFDIDTVGTFGKTNIKLIINDQLVREGDSTTTKHFKVFKISKVNIYITDSKEKSKTVFTDSIVYKNYTFFSNKKLKYKPQALTDAIFIAQNSFFSDQKTNLTNRYLNNLNVFNYPSILYKIDTNDTINNSLIANIVLTPKDNFKIRNSLDLTHSNIQDFGITGLTSITIRNVFKGAETFEFAPRFNLGSSKDLANPNNNFFNISEFGIDTKLNFPRILMPFKTEKIIPKNMIPSTVLNLGFAKQKNIGLDKENFTGSLTYNWTPQKNKTAKMDLLNLQYVNNVNINNYFNVYNSSYRALNTYAKLYNTNLDLLDSNGNLTIQSGGATQFIDAVLSGITLTNDDVFKKISSIEERRKRLTENNLILATNITFSKTTRTNLNDNNFYSFKTKIEEAGTLLTLFAAASKSLDGQKTKKTIFETEYSQYFKTEVEFVKHWDLANETILAARGFLGVAIPYGNSSSVPFSRSYFAGGSNDIRAWQPYSLGPGSSGATNDFNEANLKFTASAELRFKIFNSFKGGLFVDSGNIWNVFDNITEKTAVFEGINSLKDIAIGSGFGLRYDFSFFVGRLDLGFKTYNPANIEGQKWFQDFNFAHSVLNIGINYPF